MHVLINHFYLLFYWEVRVCFTLALFLGLVLGQLADQLFGTWLSAVPCYAYLGEVLVEEHT
jgi:hypothetical protein